MILKKSYDWHFVKCPLFQISKVVTVVLTKLTKTKWKISKSKIETKLFKVFLYIGTTKTLLKSYNSKKLLKKIHQNKSYINFKSEIFHLGLVNLGKTTVTAVIAIKHVYHNVNKVQISLT
jgi:hypothetical protein